MQFLSDEWAKAAEAALRADPAFTEEAATKRFRMWIVPDDAPPWARNGTMAVVDGEITLTPGRHGKPDAIGRASYDTWIAILRHELHPTTAAMTRRLRGAGVRALLGNRELLDKMLDVFRSIPVQE